MEVGGGKNSDGPFYNGPQIYRGVPLYRWFSYISLLPILSCLELWFFFVTRKFFKGEQMEWPEDQNSFHFE